jgi:hypothetical protein
MDKEQIEKALSSAIKQKQIEKKKAFQKAKKERKSQITT